MITKTDLKIEAARLAMDAVNESVSQDMPKEFTPLAEEIYAFLVKDLQLKDTDNPEDIMGKMASMIGQMGSYNVVEPNIKENETSVSEVGE